MKLFLLLTLLVIADMSGAAESPTGQALFQSRCMHCHQLPDPAMLRPTQWQAVLDTMQQRMRQAGLPELTEQERGLLLDYLATQAKQ